MKYLFIDGDILAFRSAAAAEERKIEVTHIKSGRTKIFKTRTEFKEFLTAKNFEYKQEDYNIRDFQVADDLANCLHTVKVTLQKIKDVVKPDITEIYLGSGETFRHQLPLPSPYKTGRDSLARPLLLSDARGYLIERHNTECITYIEADDMLSIRAYEELSKGNTSVIATLDKDANQAQGIYVYNWVKDSEPRLIPEIGSLWYEKDDVKGEGLLWLAYQMLAGDKADTYKGYELSNVKYGPKKAYNAIVECKTKDEVHVAINTEFKKLYPDEFTYKDCHGNDAICNWQTMQEMYWQCAYMRRSRSATIGFREFFETCTQ